MNIYGHYTLCDIHEYLHTLRSKVTNTSSVILMTKIIKKQCEDGMV